MFLVLFFFRVCLFGLCFDRHLSEVTEFECHKCTRLPFPHLSTSFPKGSKPGPSVQSRQSCTEWGWGRSRTRMKHNHEETWSVLSAEACLYTQQCNSPICKENEQIHLALIPTVRRLFCQAPTYSRCLINISVKLPPITISRDIFLCFSDSHNAICLLVD